MSQITQTTLSPIAVGRYLNVDGEKTSLPYSLMEVDRSRRAILRVLNTFHFRTGANILITSLFDEGAHMMPFERAVMTYGMVAASADSTPWDAKRVESIVRMFALSGAAGISGDVLDGLAQLGFKPEELFDGMKVWARPDAYERLKAFPNLDVYRWMEIGPAVAVECSQGAGAHIDRFEWNVEEIDGEVVLTNRLNRCVEFKNYHTGLKAKVHNGGCDCGNPDPRIIPA